MTSDEKKRLAELERAVDEVRNELPNKLSMSKDAEVALNKVLDLAMFVFKAWGYGKAVSTVAMAALAAWLVIEKIISGLPK